MPARDCCIRFDPEPQASDTPLTVTSISSLDAAGRLEPEWLELIDRSLGVTPFQEPGWLLPWYEVWARDRVLVLVARRASGELAGIVPAVSGDRVELAGGGVSDYLAPVIAPGPDRDLVIAALDAALASTARPVLFYDVPPDSPWASFAAAQPSWQVADASTCPIVALGADVDAWREQLPSGLQRNIRRYGTRLVDDARARFVTVGDGDDLDAALDALVALHASRWHDQQLPGVFASEDVRRFHRLSAPPLLRRGALRLHLLVAGDTVIGAQYVLVRPPRAYSYIGGFDPAWKKYGPGTLLMAYAIEQAIAGGCTEFDLLRGREPYKYTWGAVDRVSLSLERRADRA